MNSLQKLEKEARDRRAQFSKTLLDVQGRLTLSGLAHETLGLINLQHTRLWFAYSAVTRNPFLAASVLAGVGWLFKLRRRTSHGRARVRTLPSKPKR